MEIFDVEIDAAARLTAERLSKDPGYAAVRTIPGVGQILGSVFVAEIGDVSRFPGPAQLASWAGLTPKHHESDTTAHRGRITNKAAGWSAGPRWRRCNAPRRAAGSKRCISALKPDAAATSPPSPLPGN